MISGSTIVLELVGTVGSRMMGEGLNGALYSCCSE